MQPKIYASMIRKFRPPPAASIALWSIKVLRLNESRLPIFLLDVPVVCFRLLGTRGLPVYSIFLCYTLACDLSSAISVAFGLISMEHCISTENEKSIKLAHFVKACPDCSDIPRDPVCGIHPDGEGFRVRSFNNECDLKKYNCEVKENFTITDYFICSNNPNAEANETNNNKERFQNMFKKHKDSANEPTKDDKLPTMIEENNTNKFKNIVVLHGPSSLAENINKTFADFFALTHTYDIPLQSLNLSFNDTTRRKIIRNLGPVKVFKPQFTKPKIVKEDWWHLPTLQTCYHKCPTNPSSVATTDTQSRQQTSDNLSSNSGQFHTYWSNIWSNASEHNHAATWIRDDKQKLGNLPVMLFDAIPLEVFVSVITKAHNWKAAGTDKIHNYLYNKSTYLHPSIYNYINNFIKNPQSIPEFITQSLTYMIPKDSDHAGPAKYKPITYLPQHVLVARRFKTPASHA
ncbi:unnamed protein product [Spodoptera littoralis]|uniref:Kazal-like domain-containing protein n=1 Tax=Spodoptera littoralis TaxID=7109 RepID=A0A9P0I1B1_SPOLI|nr:unnamed protein product [Spodoptera littoralis]CAH1638363.1 unnamed protein product [Spodoptera littoralis]